MLLVVMTKWKWISVNVLAWWKPFHTHPSSRYIRQSWLQTACLFPWFRLFKGWSECHRVNCYPADNYSENQLHFSQVKYSLYPLIWTTGPGRALLDIIFYTLISYFIHVHCTLASLFFCLPICTLGVLELV